MEDQVLKKLNLLKHGERPVVTGLWQSALLHSKSFSKTGNRKDWFGSTGIVTLALIAAIFIPAFVAIELRKRDPLIDLRLFARRNFGLGSVVNVVLGIGLYGVVFRLTAQRRVTKKQ